MSGHLRVWRRVRLGPLLTLNIGKYGISSISAGFRGAHVTFGRRARRTTVGLPGSGVFYTETTPYLRPSVQAAGPPRRVRRLGDRRGGYFAPDPLLIE